MALGDVLAATPFDRTTWSSADRVAAADLERGLALRVVGELQAARRCFDSAASAASRPGPLSDALGAVLTAEGALADHAPAADAGEDLVVSESRQVAFDEGIAVYEATRAIPVGARDHVGRLLRQALQLAPASPFLEIGIGTGRMASLVCAFHPHVYGVDIASKMLFTTRAKLPSARLSAASATRLPFPDGTFGAVGCFLLFHVIEAWRAAVDEAWRVLAPGGRLVVSIGNAKAGHPHEWIYERYWGAVRRAATEVRRIGARGTDVRDHALAALPVINVQEDTIGWSTGESAATAVARLAIGVHHATWAVPVHLHAEGVRAILHAVHPGGQIDPVPHSLDLTVFTKSDQAVTRRSET